MLNELKKIIKEKQKLTKKINKSYKWIIISIIITALGFMLPGFLISEVAFLGNLAKIIDGLYMLLTGINEVITPIIYMGLVALGTLGTALNTIKLITRKLKLKELEIEEKGQLTEIESQIKTLENEQKLTKNELEETKEETREMLMDIKDDVLNTMTNKKKTMVNDDKLTNQQVVMEESDLKSNKVKERIRD